MGKFAVVWCLFIVWMIGCIPPKPSAQMATQIGCSKENTVVNLQGSGAYARCMSPSGPSYFCEPNGAGAWMCNPGQDPNSSIPANPDGDDIEPVADTSGKIIVKYDEFKKRTTISIQGMRLSGGIQMDMITVLPGSESIVALALRSSSSDWKYLKCHGVDWLIDDQPFSVPTSHDGDVGNGYVLEHVTSFPSYSDIARMAAAGAVKGRLCDTVFTLDSKQIKKIEEFVEKIKEKSNAPNGMPTSIPVE
jgi:hypothetical protein